MPRLSVWMIRTAIVALISGFAIGGMLLSYRGWGSHPTLLRLRPLHVELLLLGWLVNLGFGVGFWILPRPGGGRREGETVAWLGFLALNGGVIAAGLGQGWDQPSLALSGRVLECLAAMIFAVHLWRRARRSASPARG